MKVKHFFSIFIPACCLLAACHTKCDDCQPAPGNYAKGVFVANEGPFGGSGTISWYNPDTGEVQDSIFEKANNGARLGQFVQSLTFHNGKGYIVVNGANRIVVVDAATFKFVDTIGGLALPRYFLPVNNDIAFVSQWGLDGLSGSLAKVDLNTNKILATFPTGSGSEKMHYCSATKVIYVANSGGFGVDSTIAFISIDYDNQTAGKRVISGQKNPCCFPQADFNGYTPEFVLCKGDWMDPNSLGYFGQLTNPITGFSIPQGSDDLVDAPDGTRYFSSGTAIYKIGHGAMGDKQFDQPSYGFNIQPSTGNLFCADAKDFNSAGEVVIRKPDGTIVGSFRAGIAPGEIIFAE